MRLLTGGVSFTLAVAMLTFAGVWVAGSPVTAIYWVSGAALAAGGMAASTRPAVQTAPATRPAAPRNFARWEKEIARFEAMDRTNPPPKGGILFVGSSTIRGWKTLEQDFPGHVVINRGFGGSQIVDATHFAERIIFPYQPRIVFLRSGGNDIHAGKTADEVFADFKGFVEKVHAQLPETKIVFMGWSPAPIRWSERHENRRLNELVAAYVKDRPHLGYIEAYDMTVRPDGGPREELFLKDRLHFNAEGYKRLAALVRAYLEQE